MAKFNFKNIFLKISFGIVAILLLGSIVFVYTYFRHPKQEVFKVLLTSNGFYPTRLVVKPGARVVFSSTLNKDFWPASDLHPSHSLYPEFDPKKPIKPGSDWTFIFNKEGVWNFHDHLSPKAKGVIFVTKNTSQQKVQIENRNCESIKDESEKNLCRSEAIDSILEKGAFVVALEKIETYLKNDSSFEPECHTFMHKVGAGAYEQFNLGKPLNLTTQTTLCEYGFFHGFTESLISETGDISRAREFCTETAKQLQNQLSDIEPQCYHGFGHGSVNIHDENLWGDEEKMIQSALKICKTLAIDDEKLFRCGTGIFDSISISYFTHTNKLSMNPKDPFWLCKIQDLKPLKKACYVSLSPALNMMLNLDFKKAIKFVEQIQEDDLANITMGSLALPLFWIKNQSGQEAAVNMEKFYETQAAKVCKNIQNRLVLSCIQTVAYALTHDEVTTREKPSYVKGFKFCRESEFSTEEFETCQSSAWSSIRVMYPKDTVKDICDRYAYKNEKVFCDH